MWDCPACGCMQIAESVDNCPMCGAPNPESKPAAPDLSEQEEPETQEPRKKGSIMDYATLGNTGLLVSKLCFGTT